MTTLTTNKKLANLHKDTKSEGTLTMLAAALGQVEPKVEIASDDELSEMNGYPSDDLPNQEKNKY